MRCIRFSMRTMLATLTAAALCFATIGWERAVAHRDAATVKLLSAIGVSVYRSEPTVIGKTIEKLPGLSSVAPSFPRIILATEVSVSDVDTLIEGASKLHRLESIVVMEKQFQTETVARIRHALPDVEVIEAAFISGVIYVR